MPSPKKKYELLNLVQALTVRELLHLKNVWLNQTPKLNFTWTELCNLYFFFVL